MIKGILQFIAVITALTLAFAFAEAHGAEAPTVKDFAPIAAIMVQIDDVPEEFILINAKGETASIGAAACAQSQDCVIVVTALLKGGHGSVLKFNDGKQTI